MPHDSYSQSVLDPSFYFPTSARSSLGYHSVPPFAMFCVKCLAYISSIKCQPINSRALRRGSKNRFLIIIMGRWPCMGDKLALFIFS